MSDLIDRQALIESLYESFVKAQEWVFEASDAETKARAKSAVATFTEAILRVKKMPTINQVKHGKWIFMMQDDDGNGLFECSVCGKGEKHVPIVDVSYCWNCGAKMNAQIGEDTSHPFAESVMMGMDGEENETN